MIMKSAIMGGVLATLASTPYVINAAFDLPVRMSVGPVAVVFEPGEPVDLDLNAQCMARGCPFMAVEVGDSFRLGL